MNEELDSETLQQTLARELNEHLAALTDEARLEIFALVAEGYCDECGSGHLPCYCTYDE